MVSQIWPPDHELDTVSGELQLRFLKSFISEALDSPDFYSHFCN